MWHGPAERPVGGRATGEFVIESRTTTRAAQRIG
jgi:hypothetical protein